MSINNFHPSKYCCYCGINRVETKDHIPPKSIFNKPRPSNLITVPSCFDCNNKASILDEQFKIYLGLHVAKFSKEGEQLFKKGVLPTLNYTKSLKTKVITSIEPIHHYDEHGKIVKTDFSILWNSEAHDAVIERITRGLFFNHYNSIVGNNAIVFVYWFKKPTGIFEDVDMISVSIADDAFVYSYMKLEGAKYNLIWLYQFYKSHWAGAIIFENQQIRTSFTT